MNEEKEINLLDYTYEPTQTVAIPGLALMELILFAKTVATNEEQVGLSYVYSEKSKENFTEDFLTDVSEKLKEYPTAEAFFNQEPKKFISMLGAGASDLLMKLQQVHLQNIKDGVAIEKLSGEFKI